MILVKLLRNQHSNRIIHKVGVILISIHGVHNHKEMLNNNNNKMFLKNNNIYHNNNNNLYHNNNLHHLNKKIVKQKEMI